MNVFIDILFLFIYLLVLFYFKVPNITNNNYLWHKLLLFIFVIAYQYILEIIKKLKNKQDVEPFQILQDCVYYGLYSVVGYSIYIDLMYMNFGCDDGVSINIDDDVKRYIIASVVISTFILFIKLGKLMFQNEIIDR